MLFDILFGCSELVMTHGAHAVSMVSDSAVAAVGILTNHAHVAGDVVNQNVQNVHDLFVVVGGDKVLEMGVSDFHSSVEILNQGTVEVLDAGLHTIEKGGEITNTIVN